MILNLFFDRALSLKFLTRISFTLISNIFISTSQTINPRMLINRSEIKNKLFLVDIVISPVLVAGIIVSHKQKWKRKLTKTQREKEREWE